MKTKADIAEVVTRYCLAMLKDHRYVELKIRMEALADLIDMLREKGIDSFADEIVETMCFYEPLETEGD